MAKMITQIANTATKNLGGQKQLMRSPTEKVIAMAPLLVPPQRFLIKIPPQVTCTTLYGGKRKELLLSLFHFFNVFKKVYNYINSIFGF